MITPYICQQPTTDYSLRFTDVKYSATVAATTDTTLTVPGSSPRYKVIIKIEPAKQLWVALNGTAAKPAGASFAATTSELVTESVPLCREVKAGDVLHFYSPSGTVDTSIVFYGVGTNN